MRLPRRKFDHIPEELEPFELTDWHSYSLATTVQRLLHHLEEAGFYSAKDLESISQTLDTIRETLDRGKDTHSPHLLTLLGSRLEKCQMILDRLNKGLESFSPELVKLHETLVSILRSTSAANTRSKVRPASLRIMRNS